MQAEVVLNRQAEALCTFTAPFIPALHRASTNIDQTSSAPLLESHKSLRFYRLEDQSTDGFKAESHELQARELTLPPQRQSLRLSPGEGVAAALADSGGQNHGQDKGSLSRRPLPLGRASKGMRKFKGSCTSLGRTGPRLQKVLPTALFPRLGDPQVVANQKIYKEGRTSSK